MVEKQEQSFLQRKEKLQVVQNGVGGASQEAVKGREKREEGQFTESRSGVTMILLPAFSHFRESSENSHLTPASSPFPPASLNIKLRGQVELQVLLRQLCLHSMGITIIKGK